MTILYPRIHSAVVNSAWPLLPERLMEVQAALAYLLRGDRLSPEEKPDYAVSVGSLARWCRPSIDDFPGPGGRARPCGRRSEAPDLLAAKPCERLGDLLP